jgi:hypothetical protein
VTWVLGLVALVLLVLICWIALALLHGCWRLARWLAPLLWRGARQLGPGAVRLKRKLVTATAAGQAPSVFEPRGRSHPVVAQAPAARPERSPRRQAGAPAVANAGRARNPNAPCWTCGRPLSTGNHDH